MALTVEMMGPPQHLINSDIPCGEGDFPDAPARIFRDATGQMVLLATHHTNRIYVGRTLESFRKECEPVFKGADSPDPSDFDARAWIVSTWTFDGTRVASLVHNEYQAHRFSGRCKFTDYLSCWYSFVTLAVSEDGGRHFSRSSQAGPIAAPNHTADTGGPRPRGFFGSSNIVRLEDFLYAITMTTGGNGQKRGSCLLRTSNPFDESKWEMLTVDGFVRAVSNPYRGELRPPCRTLDNVHGDVAGLVKHVESGLYLAVSFMPGGKDKGALVFSSSRDLIQWSRPVRIGTLPNQFSPGCHTERFYYPSIIDFSSDSRNFDLIGDSPTLVLTHAKLDGCRTIVARQLMKIPLRISK